MGKLSQPEVEQYFENHLPYRTGILLAHYKMRHDQQGKFIPWEGEQSWLDAAFVAALVTARLYLNMLGIGRKAYRLVAFSDRQDDINVEDLGGRFVNISGIAPADQAMLVNFLAMADKAAAHFTVPITHDRRPIPKVIVLIHGYLRTHLYDEVGRSGLETVVPETP